MDAQSIAGVFGQPDLSSLAALTNMGLAAPASQEQPQGDLPLWRGPGDSQGTGFGQEDPFAREKDELRKLLARHEMAATADLMGQYAMQQGVDPMMQSMLGVDGVAQQAMQPTMQQMQSMQQQQPQQGGADTTAAAMQLVNSLQQLASAVSQATGQ